ncbi:hypothetical protein [Ruegeria lacuscaerulensis]|uniref:hypothetical protein n=1 Tax=Ruegeria lacuscaerulensis TaxID=55218 RepID=UPI00147DA643|nr:hypothetical protein [Ruegeria lacuscaerulensis]
MPIELALADLPRRTPNLGDLFTLIAHANLRRLTGKLPMLEYENGDVQAKRKENSLVA